MRLGIFGGTFDPVHFGHLILAEQCREQAQLERVLFVPAASPPHKQGQQLTSFAQRVEMLALALSGNSAFQIEEIEKERDGPSYTVDTLTAVQQKHPDAELFLLMGGDMMQDFPNWYEPQKICALATLCVVQRPGWDLWNADDLEQRLAMPAEDPIRYQQIEAPLIHIASRDLRDRLQQRRTIRYLVPRAVEAYLEDKRLYLRDGTF